MTPEEVAYAESRFSYLQIGQETVSLNGKFTFTNDKAEYLFWEYLESLRHMSKFGTDDDKRTAYEGLVNFRLHKLRLH